MEHTSTASGAWGEGWKPISVPSAIPTPIPFPTQHPCPACGYCPACGRSNTPWQIHYWPTTPAPFYPVYPFYNY